MNPEILVYLAVSVYGVVLFFFFLQARRYGWFRYLFLILVIQGTRDLGISPLFAELTSQTYPPEVFGRAHGMAALSALGVMMLSYGSLWMGIWSAYFFAGLKIVRRMNQEEGESVASSYSSEQLEKGFLISSILAMVGLFANVVVIRMLMSEFTLGQIASTRAVFSSNLNLTDFRYAYLRSLSTFLQIGSLAMICFSQGRGRRYYWAVFLALVQIVFEVIYGGRARMLQGFILLALAINLVRPIKFRQAINSGIVAFALLIFIGFIRSDVNGLGNMLSYSVKSFAMQDYARVDDTAYIMSLFPDQIPFTGWLNFLGSIVRIIPAAALPGTNSLYGYIVQGIYGGVNPQSGIGAWNYSTGAELYSWGGIASVVFFGLVYGVIYSFIFVWVLKNRYSVPVMVFCLIFFVKSFFMGVQSRLPDTLSAISTVFFPLAMLAGALTTSRYKLYFYLLLAVDAGLFVLLNILRDSGNTAMPKICILVSVPFLYFFSVRLMRFPYNTTMQETTLSLEKN